MSEPKQTERILDLIRKISTNEPSLRVSQALINAMKLEGAYPEIFHYEDARLEQALIEFEKTMRHNKPLA